MTGIIQEMRRVVAGVIGDDNQANDIVYALVSNFGGAHLYMPANDYESRKREIVSMNNAGATVECLAKRFRLSERTIYRILGTT
jgi:Mor family transcriptional regulator